MAAVMRLSLFVLTLIMTANALNDTCRNVVYHVQNLKQDVKQVTTLFIVIPPYANKVNCEILLVKNKDII